VTPTPSLDGTAWALALNPANTNQPAAPAKPQLAAITERSARRPSHLCNSNHTGLYTTTGKPLFRAFLGDFIETTTSPLRPRTDDAQCPRTDGNH
jgi:hypothetical protein